MTNVASEFGFLQEEAEQFAITDPIPPVKRETTKTAAGAVSSIVWGDSAPSVTLLHGGGLNAHTWDATVLSLGLPALAIDLPGHGDSDWRDDADYSPLTIAPAVIEAIDAAGAKDQLLVGQSLGGLTAAAVAGARPDLVRALVLVDVSPGLRPGDASQVRDFLAGAQVFASRDEIVEKALAFGIGASRSALERGVALNTNIRDDGTVVFKHHLANLPEGAPGLSLDFTALWPALESVKVPVLLVHGEHGFLSPEVVAELLERIPGSTEISVPTGHNVQEQAPVLLADILKKFDTK